MSALSSLHEDPRHAGAKPTFHNAKEQQAPGSEASMDPRPDFGEHSYKGLGRLQGVKAVITGADSGIGRAVALAFAREGADIVAAYLNEDEDARETERVVKAAGRECHLVPGDLSTEKHCELLIEQAVQKFGRIDCLVLNAAFQGKACDDITKFERERVEHTFLTNIVAMFSLVKYAIPHMKEGSTIITTSSIQGYDPSSAILDYACTKASIVAFTKGLAQQLVSKGIRVNSVAPGPVWTPLIEASFPKEKSKEFGTQAPMKRPGQPVELSPAYVFLASKESSYVSGQILGVTGGSPTM